MHRHPFEPVSLIFGLLFTGIGLVALTGDVGVRRLDWSWFWPLVLLIGGVAVLLTLRAGSGEASKPEERTRS